MHNRSRFANVLWDASLRPGHTALVILLMLLFLIFLLMFLTFTAQPAQGQTYQVLCNFTGGIDGSGVFDSVTIDRAGNLYGTAQYGGYRGGGCNPDGCGTVFRLSYKDSRWILTPLLVFNGSAGREPTAPLTLGTDGSLYGSAGGVAFNFRPGTSSVACVLCGWTETVLSTGGIVSNLTFDQSGNIYAHQSRAGNSAKAPCISWSNQTVPGQQTSFIALLVVATGIGGLRE